jgi:hypothetical protein
MILLRRFSNFISPFGFFLFLFGAGLMHAKTHSPPLSYSQFKNWMDFNNNMVVTYHFRRIVRIPFSQKFLHEIDET